MGLLRLPHWSSAGFVMFSGWLTGRIVRKKHKQEIIDGNKYLDEKVYVTACGALQEWVFALLRDTRCKLKDVRWGMGRG